MDQAAAGDRRRCPNCDRDLPPAGPDAGTCPVCGAELGPGPVQAVPGPVARKPRSPHTSPTPRRVRRASRGGRPVEVEYSRCLYCHRSIDAGGEEAACPHCGHHAHRSLYRIHWTLDPRLVRMEKELKIIVLVFCILLCGGLLLTMVMGGGTGMGVGAGWFLAIPAALVYALWQTCSKVTQHASHFNAKLVWGICLGVAGLVIAPFVIMQVVSLVRGTFDPPDWLPVILLDAGALAILTGFWLLCGVLDHWKARRMAEPVPLDIVRLRAVEEQGRSGPGSSHR